MERILWANLHLLFWLSLTRPFVTSWMGDTHFARVPVVAYGAVLLGFRDRLLILTITLLARHGKELAPRRRARTRLKGKISIVLYAAGSSARSWIPASPARSTCS
jgi:uncharacterized membrane protein